MAQLLNLLVSEVRKLRRSAALRLLWVFPVLFILVDVLLSGLPLLLTRQLTAEAQQGLNAIPIKSLADTWSGYFHPLLVALLPPLLFRSEHRFSLWKHLHVQPVSRRAIFATKALILGLCFGLVLSAILALLWVESRLIGYLNPLVHSAFPWTALIRVLAWSYLGSLPLLALYLWLSDRIDNAAVPIMFAMVGLLLTISLGGKELYPMWRRDFIPWVLPYTCAQQAIDIPGARQEMHTAQKPFYNEQKLSVPKVTIVGKYRIEIQDPDDLLGIPPPTSKWALGTFSLGCTLVLLTLGLVEAGRDRA
ncbi:MAG: ABC transporter permease [Geothrix sp.]|uniref:ABC transporter permease n=1 Tax=Geothrix sp. TaxID=1962974 RepID=UPI0017FC50BF|nr:ABC transporter permease [Geothrix sp.]NWJ42146.1 ABC transporter permease [Geothrix sp.]WIL19891.1 MAG: ABC transporter permease [Geothrix sp.]